MKISAEKILEVGFGLAFLALATVGMLQYRSTRNFIEAGHAVNHTDRVMAQIESVLVEAKDADSAVRAYVATGDDKFLVPYQGAAEESASRLQQLRQLTTDDQSQQKRMDILEPLVRRRFEHLAKVLANLREGRSESARAFMTQNEGLRLTNSIVQLSTEMENEERVRLSQRTAAAEAVARRTIAILIAGNLVAFALLLGAGLIIRRDVGARKRTDEALRRANAYNRSLIEASLDPLVTISPEGKVTDVNEATIKATGIGRQELVGTDFCDYFTEPQKAREGYLQVFAEGFVTDYPLILRHRDGKLIDVLYNASVYRDAQGKVLGVFAAARDITERKRTEKALRAERQRFLEVLEILPFYTLLLTPDYHVAFANRIFRERFGESNGRRCYEFLFNRTEPCEICETPRVLKTRAPHRWEWTGPDGRNYEIHDFPFRDAGRSSLVMVVGLDITESKMAEQKILKLNAELEERVAARTAELTASNQEMEAFTYAVAHDLRAPLRHIQGFSGMLIDDCGSALDENAQRYLERIRDGVNRMTRLLEDLLNLSRLGREELSLQACGLNSLVEEVVQDLKTEINGRQIEWRIGRLPFVACDPGLMKQVFTNLLSNAVKYTRPRDKAVIQVDQTNVDGHPAVYVRDNGVGFSMKAAGKLFGIFQRLHRQEDFEGTGVGLATVQRIIHKHRGRVWAEAELDKGATFYFALGNADDTERSEKSLRG